jgi:ParB-like chromosome segregation protein Spo0J
MKETFETKKISRSAISLADYNPRTISVEAKKKLKKSLKEFGLVEPLVWNERTGRLVSGHQRLSILDEDAKGKDYEITVARIDVDEKTEKKINVYINNQSAMGEFDSDLIFNLIEESNLSFEELGFELQDAEVLFGENDRFADIFNGSPAADDLKDETDKTKRVEKWVKDRQALRDTTEQDFNIDYYFTVVCGGKEEKKALLKRIGVPEYEEFVLANVLEKAIKQ